MKPLKIGGIVLCMAALLLTACGSFAVDIATQTPAPTAGQQTATPEPPGTPTHTVAPSEVPPDCEAHCVDGECEIACPPSETPETPWELTYDGTPWATPQFTDSTTPEPYPAHPVDVGPHLKTYLLLGSDNQPHRNSSNTDAIMLLIADEREGKVTAISFPRDLYVFVPGHGMSRINSAYPIGGFPMIEDVFEYNFGIPISEGYIHMEISAFRDFIDWMGGVDVYARESVLDECSGGIKLNYLEGRTYQMDGRTALCYARARMASSDYDRMRRQQEILIGVARGSLGHLIDDPAGFTRKVWEVHRDSVETNLTLPQLVNGVRIMIPIDLTEDIHTTVIQPPLVRQWTKPTSGAWLLLPNTDLQQWIIDQVVHARD